MPQTRQIQHRDLSDGGQRFDESARRRRNSQKSNDPVTARGRHAHAVCFVAEMDSLWKMSRGISHFVIPEFQKVVELTTDDGDNFSIHDSFDIDEDQELVLSFLHMG